MDIDSDNTDSVIVLNLNLQKDQEYVKEDKIDTDFKNSNDKKSITINNNQYEFRSYPILYRDKNWPVKTNVFCWWCCHSFESIPIPIPISYDERQDKFKVYGNFCSFSCARAYLKNETPLYKNCDNYQLLNYMEYKCTGKYDKNNTLAPPKYTLKIFGGHLDIKDFRENSSLFTIIKHPFIPLETYTQEQKQIEVINEVPKNRKFSLQREKITKKGLSSLGIKTIKKN